MAIRFFRNHLSNTFIRFSITQVIRDHAVLGALAMVNGSSFPRTFGVSSMAMTLTVNGKKRSVDAEPDKPLLWALREDCELPGTKFGCGAGLCGACTVLLDGMAVRSCQTSIADATGSSITTIEGVADLPIGKTIADAWIALDVPQCGYCQAGQIMSATALLMQTPKPSDEDIVSGMDGNICRCATYLRIKQAIRKAAGIEDEAQ